MQIVTTQKITVTRHAPKGSNRVEWNVDLNGVPFGQVWTYRASGERHPFHAKTLTGNYATFATQVAAVDYLRGLM